MEPVEDAMPGNQSSLEAAVARLPETLVKLMQDELRAEFRELKSWSEKSPG